MNAFAFQAGLDRQAVQMLQRSVPKVPTMRIFVAIATVGRPDLIPRTVDFLGEQTRPADGIIIATVSPDDVSGIERLRGNPEVIFAPRGLCAQRNEALCAVRGRADIVVFLDDDFLPATDFLSEIERLFMRQSDVVGDYGRLDRRWNPHRRIFVRTRSIDIATASPAARTDGSQSANTVRVQYGGAPFGGGRAIVR